MKKLQHGFTLIEIMIVVAVLAIIAAVAVPSYREQVKKGRRSDAQQLMLEISSKQEQYLLDARTYTESMTDLGVSKEGWTCVSGSCSNNFYSVTIDTGADAITGPGPEYVITADAIGIQADDGDMTLNSIGTRTRVGADSW